MIIAQIKAKFPCDVITVWNSITNTEEYAWRSDLQRIEVIDDVTFIEYTKKGIPTYFMITNKDTYKEYEFTIKNKNISGRWIGKFKQIDTGCEVEFIEYIEVKNVIMRLFARMYLKKQQKLYIEDLTKKVNGILYDKEK